LLSKASIHHNGKIIDDDVKREPILNEELYRGNSSMDEFLQSPTSPEPALSPRRRQAAERQAMIQKVRYFVVSPFPYMILILLVVMIIMIFVDIMPISGNDKSPVLYK
jgi:hypothetical protein